MLDRLRSLSRSETGRAAELGAASMAGNVVALVFTVVFTRVLGQDDYGSLAALISTLLILNVPGYALQTTVAREVSAALAAGDPHAGAAVGRWLTRLSLAAAVLAAVAALARQPLGTLVGVGDAPWGAAAVPVAGALWLMLSIERGALVGFQRYRLVGASIVVEQLARLGFGLALAGSGFGVTGAFLGTPLSMGLMALVLWRPLHAHVGSARRVRELPGHRLRDLARRAWAPIAALGLIAWLQDGHVIIVKHLASSHDAGAWAAVAVAAKAIVFVAIGLAGYLVPEVSRRASRGTDPRHLLVRTLGLVAILAVPMVLVYAAAGSLVLRVAFHVHGGASALPLLGAAMALLACVNLASQYQLALHRTRFILALAAGAAAMPVILLTIGAHLTALAAGLAALILVLAGVLLTLAMRRAPGRPAPELPPEAVPVVSELA